jgi:hypothetical protein
VQCNTSGVRSAQTQYTGLKRLEAEYVTVTRRTISCANCFSRSLRLRLYLWYLLALIERKQPYRDHSVFKRLRRQRTRSSLWYVSRAVSAHAVCARCVGSAEALGLEQGHDPLFWVVALTLTEHAIVLSRSRDFSAWMSGWFSNQTGRRVVDLLVHQKNIEIVKSWCQSHPQASVMMALQSAIGPQ